MGSGRRRLWTLLLGGLSLTLATLSVMTAAGAVTLPLPPIPGVGSTTTNPNDLAAIGQGFGQTPTPAPVQHPAEPPLTATPLAPCGPGSHPEPGVDGRVPAGSGVNGLNCNLSEIAHQGTSGGFKVFRYVDTQGHVCAFYDTALLFPTNAVNAAGPSLGVAVLDMSDPTHPVQTDTLNAEPMLTPHESLNLNATRGLLAAVSGNPSTEPGVVAIYDVHQDCRHPVLDSTSFVARLGHESGFSPDGRTFYATATATPGITAVDITDPTQPHAIWQGNVTSHGMTLSDDGNRAYVADPSGGQMAILDTSQIQARKPNPQVREISRITWNSASIPQNAIPFTEDGHPYVLEFDEYTQQTLNPSGDPNAVGAARIIDISDESHPFVVANLRLAVDNPAEHAAASGDPGTMSPAQGYAAHYCNIPTRVDPKLVACSFIASGLRVFDISDLLHPREVGYFVAPTTPNTETGYSDSDYAMSQPAFDVARHDIWYTDGGTGFYVVHVADAVWPVTSASAASPTCPVATGLLQGKRLGPVALGMTRAQARRAFAADSGHAQANTDAFCLRPSGITVAYPSGAYLRHLRPRLRRQVAGRVVVALTGNPDYALRGVRPGDELGPNAGRLRTNAGIQIGANRWYTVYDGGVSHGLLEVRNGVIEQVGIASRALTGSNAALRRLLLSVR